MNTADDIKDQNFEGIAVIGMSGAFPRAKNIKEFWNNLKNGIDGFADFTDEELIAAGVEQKLLSNPKYVKRGAVLGNADLFDAKFFGYTPREAEFMDPQHRLFLEHSWLALEDAGYDPEKFDGAIGVYAGCSINNYLLKNLIFSPHKKTIGDFQTMIGNDKDFLTTRVSYKLNLKGPSIDIQTACSTSLVAVQIACQSLLNYQCDMALSGGATVTVPSGTGYLYQEGLILSPDGYCRSFDSKSAGAVFGEGIGIVVLKRMEDAINDGDYIYAVIKGSAINNDGSMKAGYTAPSVDGQAEVIATAHALAEVAPDTITYVESHGTGTPIGDPIEIAALTKAFRAGTEKNGFCAIGSVKTNVGHLDAAAGITGLIKTVLSLKEKQIPPILHFEKPNPKIDFKNSPFYVNTTLTQWETNGFPRRAGVSSFGIGGTNAHVIVEESPPYKKSKKSSRQFHLLLLSAKSESALQLMSDNIINFIKENPDESIADMAFTLQAGRRAFEYRQVVICQDLAEAINALNSKAPARKLNLSNKAKSRSVVFMFSGQGSQFVNMGLELYQEEPVFRKNVDYCSNVLKKFLGFDIRDILYPTEEKKDEASKKLNETYITQPALFIIEYSLSRLFLEWGIKPNAMIGHSLGEYTAACISGVFTLDEALELVVTRGQLMQEAPAGSMLVIPLNENDLKPLLNDALNISVVNSPSRCVVSGSEIEIKKLQDKLNGIKIPTSILRTSHAFHSPMMDEILEPYLEKVKQVKLNPPAIPFVSNVTGQWISVDKATDPEYWVRHIRKTVQFSNGIQEILKDTDSVLLEIGPGNTLCTFGKQQPDSGGRVIQPSMKNHAQADSDTEFFLKTIGRLWISGVDVNCLEYYKNDKRRRIPLPGYPFKGKRYWIEQGNQVNFYSNDNSSNIECSEPNLDGEISKSLDQNGYPLSDNDSLDQRVAKIWINIFGYEEVSNNDNFFEIGGDSLMATQLIANLNKELKLNIPIRNLFLEPTIEGLSRKIKSDMLTSIQNKNFNKSEFSLLFPIQPKGNRPTLFLVAGAHAVMYSDFAEMKMKYEEAVFRYFSAIISNLGFNQPVYGFLPKGLIINEDPHKSVKEMASAYIQAMRKFQPIGPYLIGGECVGGVIAYEMAQQLISQNEEVLHLILMDTFRPSTLFSLKERFLFIRRNIFRYLKNYKNIGLSKTFQKLFGYLWHFIILPFQSKEKRNSSQKSRFRVYNHQKTLLHYRPKSYNGKVTLLANEQWLSKNKTLGWSRKVCKQLDIKVVTGDHVTRLTTYGHISGSLLTEAIDNAMDIYNKNQPK